MISDGISSSIESLRSSSYRRRKIGSARLLNRRSLSLDETAKGLNGKFESKFIKGEPGRNGLDGLPGLDGAPGLDGIPGIDGRNGRDGIDGRDGKDGKDGQPGERGQPGLPGPAGEVGRRGKPGPAGKIGAPGPPGVCAYRAKYDCSLLSTNNNNNDHSSNTSSSSSSSKQQDHSQALLLAPTMVGQSSGNDSDANDERQVTVTEGDNIQLSCEAFALPKPTYVWHRSDKKSTILLDVSTLFKVTSFPGSQLPFVRVDRLQAGSYECVASNGIPPVAKKRINLDVNYAPTIRIYPGPSVYRVELGSSILIECIVEANPSSFSYFMFGSESLMSISPNNPLQLASSFNQALESASIGGDNKLNDGFDESDIISASSNKESSFNANGGKQYRNSRYKKYIITESTGQLSTGASYSILTLNITNISRDDLGVYKCISKNLIGQSTGYIWLESLEDDSSLSSDLKAEDLKIRQLILEKSQIYERLDHTIDWPNYLVEREANYSTFGNDHRQQIVNLISRKLSGKPVSDEDFDNTITLLRRPGARKFNQTQQSDTTETDQKLLNNKANTFPEEVERQSITTTTSSSTDSTNAQTTQSVDTETSPLATKTTSGPSNEQASPIEVNKHQIRDDNSDSDNDIFELCRAELIIEQQDKPIERSSIMLLDQVGKPVYLGNMAENSLNWWSLDSKLEQQHQQQNDGETQNTKVDRNQVDMKSHYFSTSPNHPDKLFEYESLNDLLKDQQHVVAYNGDNNAHETNNLSTSASSPSSHIIHKLKHKMYGNSHLIYGGSFYYVTFLNDSQDVSSQNNLDNLSIVIVDIRNNLYRYVNLNGKLSSAFENQPMNLDMEYKLNRVELASDENGVWIILPTIERKSHLMRIPSKYKDLMSTMTITTTNQSNNSQQPYNNRSKIVKLDNYQGRWQEKQKELLQTMPTNQPVLHLSETRRLHVLKLRSNFISNQNENNNNNNGGNNVDNFAKIDGDDTIGDKLLASGYTNNNRNNNITRMIDYHVSMKLDWRMIGQIFIIDGVLYGIKDRHLYSSKLQFAYDLYKCKLLSTEYLNESHRTFTNHFGNTQMIKYNPNEPKRLYTIDSGNLLWCPVKLIKTNPNDIWQQQQQLSKKSNNN